MAILALAVSSNKNLRIVLASDKIPPHKADRMRHLFRDSPTKYSIERKTLSDFVRDCKGITPPSGSKIGIGILPGRADGNNDFNIALEAVQYSRTYKDEPVDFVHLLTNDEYFGLVSPDFKPYKRKADRDEVNKAIKNKDSATSPFQTELILIEIDKLSDFLQLLDKQADVQLEFGRDLRSFKLAMIITGTADSPQQPLLFLDDHDLIPPPDVES